MKTAFLHGAGIAIAVALSNLGFFFAGVHSSPERLASTQWLGTLVLLGLSGTGLTLAVRERRMALPPEKAWGFAPAFGTGVLTGLFAALLGIGPSYVYFSVINPGFSDVLVAMQRSALEAKGLSDAEVERIIPMMEKFTLPGVLTASGACMGFVWSSVVALVVGFFLRGKPTVTGS